MSKNDDVKRLIRKAVSADIPSIMSVVEAAKQIMRSSGNLGQWADGYPSEGVIMGDIAVGGGYVVVDCGQISGYFALLPSPEPTYSDIYDGCWKDETSPYHVIHRVASYPNSHHIFRDIVDFSLGIDSNIRIDTHRDNLIMRHVVEQCGFLYCGIIYLSNGDERLAYQLLS